MLKMRYNGVERLVEPYSFRTKSTGVVFMGWCGKDQGIEAFKPDKIEAIEVTDVPFRPRWTVEVGRG
jgi:predicted DNA-binding transcriptional regulator YafY